MTFLSCNQNSGKNRDFFAITDGKRIRGEYAQGGTLKRTNTQENFAYK
ncbi:hypothetical protein ACE193_17890 [Bernardetia sp. OM2101]